MVSALMLTCTSAMLVQRTSHMIAQAHAYA